MHEPPKKKVPGKPFVKGDPRIGRHALPPDIRESRKIAFHQYNAIALELLNAPYSTIKDITSNDQERTDKRMIAAAIRFGIEGNQPSLNAVWDRVYGKVPEIIDHSGLSGSGLDISKLPLEKRKQIRDILLASGLVEKGE